MTIAARQGLAASDVQPARSNKFIFFLPFLVLIIVLTLVIYQKSNQASAYDDHENFRLVSQIAYGINERLNSFVQMLEHQQGPDVIKSQFRSYISEDPKNVNFKNFELVGGRIVFHARAGNSAKIETSVKMEDLITFSPGTFSKIIIVDAKSNEIGSIGPDNKVAAEKVTFMLNESHCRDSRSSYFSDGKNSCQAEYTLDNSDVMDVELAGDSYRVYIYPFRLEGNITKPDKSTTVFLMAFTRSKSSIYNGIVKSPLVVISLLLGMLCIWCILKVELQSEHHPISKSFSRTTIFLFFTSLVLVYSVVLSFYFSHAFKENRLSYGEYYAKRSILAVHDAIDQAIENVKSNKPTFESAFKIVNEKADLTALTYGGESFLGNVYKKYNNYYCHFPYCKHFYLYSESKDYFDFLLPNTEELKSDVVNKSGSGNFNFDAFSKKENRLYKSPYKEIASCTQAKESVYNTVCHYNFSAIDTQGKSKGVNFSFREVYRPPQKIDLSHRDYVKNLYLMQDLYRGNDNSGDYERYYAQRLNNIGDGTKGTTVSVFFRSDKDKEPFILNSDITSSAFDYFSPKLFDMSAFIVDKKTGVVQYHNDSTLELNENVFSADVDNSDLENFIRNQAVPLDYFVRFEGSYHGQPGTYLVTGMKAPNWVYVVFVPELPTILYEKSIFISFFTVVIVIFIFLLLLLICSNKWLSGKYLKNFLGLRKDFKTSKAVLYFFGFYMFFQSVVLVFNLYSDHFFVFGFLFSFLFISVGLQCINKFSMCDFVFRSVFLFFRKAISIRLLGLSAAVSLVLLLAVSANWFFIGVAENYISSGMLKYYCIQSASNSEVMKKNAQANFKYAISNFPVDLSRFSALQQNNNNSIAPSQICPDNFRDKVINPAENAIFDEENVFVQAPFIYHISSLLQRGEHPDDGFIDFSPLYKNAEIDIYKPDSSKLSVMSEIHSKYFNYDTYKLSFLISPILIIVFIAYARIYLGYVSQMVYGKIGMKKDIAKLSSDFYKNKFEISQERLVVSLSKISLQHSECRSFRDVFSTHNADRPNSDLFFDLNIKLSEIRPGYRLHSDYESLNNLSLHLGRVTDGVVLTLQNVEQFLFDERVDELFYAFVGDIIILLERGHIQCFVICVDENVLQSCMAGLTVETEENKIAFRWLSLFRRFIISTGVSNYDGLLNQNNSADSFFSIMTKPLDINNNGRSYVLSEESRVFFDDELKYFKELSHLQTIKTSLHPSPSEPLLRKNISVYGRQRMLLILITQRAQLLYRYHWFLCSNHEKICLYFLATKGTFNPKNQSTLESLAAKGLIRMSKGRIVPVNQSFAHFIRHAESSPAMRALINETERGVWKLYKYPLTFVVGLAILTTCIIGAQSLSYVVSSVVALVTLIGGVANNFSLIRNVVRAH